MAAGSVSERGLVRVVLVVAVYDLLRFGDELEVYAAGVGGWPCHDRIAGARRERRDSRCLQNGCAVRMLCMRGAEEAWGLGGVAMMVNVRGGG